VTAAILLLALVTGNAAWKDFADWFSKEGTPGSPAEVIRTYSSTLKTRGTPDAEIAERTKAVQDYAAANPREALALHFNRIYTWADAPFSREPSAFLRRLDIAMGQGRNSIWLAKAGWSVSGYDISGEALSQAAAGAAKAGVKLDTKLASHDEYDLGQGKWDLIVMSFAFTKLSDETYMKRVRDALRPGGILLVEGFNGGPRQSPNWILKDFLDYHVLAFEDLPDVADWGRMKAPLLRMALEKP
jgi:2-polyprenyl-3-methyl-5-hydroxy-6-metoxy-1,4-benzoquinol methylase